MRSRLISSSRTLTWCKTSLVLVTMKMLRSPNHRSRPERDQTEISMAADRSTHDEDDLKSSLQRTRKSKLSALQHNTHHHRHPVSSGTPAMGPRRLREDNKPYGRVNRKRSPRHAPRVHPSSFAHTPSQFVSPTAQTLSGVSPVHSCWSSLSSAPSPHTADSHCCSTIDRGAVVVCFVL